MATDAEGPRASARAKLLAAFDTQLRGRPSATLQAGAHQEQDGPVFRSWGASPRGFVCHRDLGRQDRPQLEALIRRQLEFFGQRGLGFEWKTYGHDSTAELPGRLLAAGFEPEERESLVIGLVAELNQNPELPPGVSLRQVRSRQDSERMAVLLSAVDGADRGFLGDLFFRDAQACPDDVVLLVAEFEGQVVATARINFESGTEFATLWAGSTLAAWRRRGIYRASVAYRAGLAAGRGFKYLQVDASEASRPILERLGFLTVSSTTPYVWSPPQ